MMCRAFICFTAVFLLSLVCSNDTPAKIIYVDAVDADTEFFSNDPNITANTTLVTGGEFIPTQVGGLGTDGYWRMRPFGNEGTIFEAGGAWGDYNTEDCRRLKTSVDVPLVDYLVYVYFWADENPWRIQASLEDLEGDLPLYLAHDPNGQAIQAVTQDFAEPVPLVAEGDRTLWQVCLGTTGLTTRIDVYIDDDPNHLVNSARTWYDGIGYEVAPPKIVYVDATDGENGNTTLATGEPFYPVDIIDTGPCIYWRKRYFGNEYIFEATLPWESNCCTNDSPRLNTSIDVPEADYLVYVYFWADPYPWRICAALEDLEDDLPLYLANDPNGKATQAVAQDFSEPVPLVTEANRTLWQVCLGTTGLTSRIDVYIDDEPNSHHSARTWYDGIGYKVAPPKIVYVDATDGEAGNTTYATGGAVEVDPTVLSGTDNLWRKRPYANEGTIYEAGGAWGLNYEDCPRLKTSIDVPLADYLVYVFFWASDAPWRIQAALEDLQGDLPLYLAHDPNSETTQAVTQDFAEPVPMVAEGNRTLWQVCLGTTGLTSRIDVYIDDEPDHLTGNKRTWYDGIGYKVARPGF